MKSKDKSKSTLSSLIVQSPSAPSGLISESLNFEDCIINSSKASGSFSREWVEAEVEKSSAYFTKEIYSDA